jgi:Xaa-Pro dipeptidase
MGPAFAESEHRDRLRRARATLRSAGVDGAICVAPEHLFYLAGYDAHTHFSHQGLVFSADEDEPTLVIRDVDVPSAAETSWIRDVRGYHFGRETAAQALAEAVREKGLAGGRLGVETNAYAFPAAFADGLRAALGPDAVLVDSGRLIGMLRVVKSPAEMEYVRRAAACSLAGIEAGLAALRPGISEVQLAGEIEHALRSRGSDYPAMPTWVRSGPRTALGHAMPTDRVVRPGEPSGFSFSGVARRYHVSVYHTVHLGPPEAWYSDLYNAARESMQALVAGVGLGQPVAVAAQAAHASLARRGLDHCSKMRYGYGVGIGYPPAWLEPFDITEESDQVFLPNTVFCLHVHLSLPERERGLIVGGDYLLNDDGLEPLDTTGGSPERRELMVV